MQSKLKDPENYLLTPDFGITCPIAFYVYIWYSNKPSKSTFKRLFLVSPYAFSRVRIMSPNTRAAASYHMVAVLDGFSLPVARVSSVASNLLSSHLFISGPGVKCDFFCLE